MNPLRFAPAPLLAGALALATLSPWSPLGLSAAPADAQSRVRTNASININLGKGHSLSFGHRGSSFHGFSRNRRTSFGHGFNRSSHRSFGRSNSRRSFSRNGFRTGSHRSFRSNLHLPHAVVIEPRYAAPAYTPAPGHHDYPAAAGPTANDAWAHLSAGRSAQAQQIFGLLAGTHPTHAAPKAGYGIAALLRGEYANAERALLRAHQADPGIWQTLRQQPQARAAALDLLQQPEVQHSETLRTAMSLIAKAPRSTAAQHDYGIGSTEH